MTDGTISTSVDPATSQASLAEPPGSIVSGSTAKRTMVGAVDEGSCPTGGNTGVTVTPSDGGGRNLRTATTPRVAKYVAVAYSTRRDVAGSAPPCRLTLICVPPQSNAVTVSNSGAALSSRS